jgi:hypothetical protein
MEREMRMTKDRKQTRIRLVLAAAAALGCTSATFSGALTALALQNVPGEARSA